MRRVKTPVDYETAKQRALSILKTREPTAASEVGCAIWPDVVMTGQGIGGAASRILRKMEKEGLVHWTPGDGVRRWGWVRRVANV